jgi:CubicO group peptidase (beta-lactamase class C family)
MARLFHKTILTALLLAVLWAPGLFPTHAASAATGLGNPAEVEAFFDGAMAAEMSARHIPGAVVSVVEDGQVLFNKGYGFADLENQTLVDPQRTLFRAGSVSKLFGATAVMQLAEQGKLDLDADVNTYLDFKIPATFPQAITLKNLLTHTAGFEDIGQDLFNLNAEEIQTLGQYLKTHIPARVFPPGKLAAYSNYGAALAAYIVEGVSGLPFTEYVEKNIFTPLGMSHSTFLQPLPADLAGDLSSGYDFVRGG